MFKNYKDKQKITEKKTKYKVNRIVTATKNYQQGKDGQLECKINRRETWTDQKTLSSKLMLSKSSSENRGERAGWKFCSHPRDASIPDKEQTQA